MRGFGATRGSGRVSRRRVRNREEEKPLVTRAARSTTAGSRTCTLVVLNESCTGWPHAASSPPCSLACDACVAPEASPRARCQCSPWTTTYLHETPTPEALEPNPVAPVSSPRKTTSAVSPTAVSAPREGAPRKDVPRTIARESADARAPNVSGARREPRTTAARGRRGRRARDQRAAQRLDLLKTLHSFSDRRFSVRSRNRNAPRANARRPTAPSPSGKIAILL